MKRNFWVGAAISIFIMGCASNREMLSTAVSEAEGMGRAARAEGITSPATVQGDKDLALSKQLSEEGKTWEAYDAAMLSRLEYRLAFAEKDARNAALADSTVSRELLGDRESQKLYKTILENELEQREAGK